MLSVNKEWRAPFNEDAIVKFGKTNRSSVFNKIEKGTLVNPEEKRRKHIAISKKDAEWYINYLLECGKKYGIVYDYGKLSRSNDPRYDNRYHKGLTIYFIKDVNHGDTKFVTAQVKRLLNIDYLVKIDEYKGYERFYIATTFVDEETKLYMKVSLAENGELWIDIHPRGWF